MPALLSLLAPLARRILPPLLIVAAILSALWWVDHEGYRRARQDAAAERAATALMLANAARDSEARLATRIAAIDADTARARNTVAATRTILQPTLIREIARETRYSDPASGISDGLRAAIDRARAALACTAAADGRIVCAVPATAPAPGQ